MYWTVHVVSADICIEGMCCVNSKTANVVHESNLMCYNSLTNTLFIREICSEGMDGDSVWRMTVHADPGPAFSSRERELKMSE